MTTEEFSNNFSTLLNSYGSIADFGEQASRQEIVLDEYEKSVFLTQAQDIIVKSYYDKTLNSQGAGFDDNSRRQVDFSSLITVAEIKAGIGGSSEDETLTFDDRGVLFKLPTTGENSSPAVLLIVNEKLIKLDNDNYPVGEYVIKPIANTEYDREMSKAYAKPLKKQAWRLFQNQATGFDTLSEIIPRDKLDTGESWLYRIRYVRRPAPIILENLGEDLTIDGKSYKSECELNPILHMDILMKAIELAYASRGNSLVQTGRTQQNQEQK